MCYIPVVEDSPWISGKGVTTMKLLRDGEMRARIREIVERKFVPEVLVADVVDIAFRVYRATVYAAVEGQQRKASAGWNETRARAQAAALRAVRKAARSVR